MKRLYTTPLLPQVKDGAGQPQFNKRSLIAAGIFHLDTHITLQKKKDDWMRAAHLKILPRATAASQFLL